MTFFHLQSLILQIFITEKSILSADTYKKVLSRAFRGQCIAKRFLHSLMQHNFCKHNSLDNCVNLYVFSVLYKSKMLFKIMFFTKI